MRLHFKKDVEVGDVYDDLPLGKVGAVHLRERPNVEVLVDLYDSATEHQIQRVIDRAAARGLILVKRETGTFVVGG